MGRRVYADLDAFFRGNPDMSMQQLAEQLGVTLSMVSYMRNGLRQPRLDLAVRIVELCNIPIESLIVTRQLEKAS